MRFKLKLLLYFPFDWSNLCIESECNKIVVKILTLFVNIAMYV